MSEQLEDRVAKLERQNRRLQFALGAVVTVLLGIALAVAFAPQRIPDVIEARAFHVRDQNGALRTSIDLDGLAVRAPRREQQLASPHEPRRDRGPRRERNDAGSHARGSPRLLRRGRDPALESSTVAA